MTRMILACLMGTALAAPAHAQSAHDLHRAADSAIASDIAKDRQAERDEKRWPYASPGQGGIATASAARNACAAKARQEAGRGAVVIGRPLARSMSTGWEVSGEVGPVGDARSMPFVCSVRNGSISGILLQPED